MNNSYELRDEGGENGGVRQLLTFTLGGEVYGVNILRVKEIRGWAPVTRIPQSPAAVLGVLNLRGLMVPIFDLRVRFGLKAAEFTALTVIVVLSSHTQNGQREFGIVVDSVNDVVDIAPDTIKPVPSLSGVAASEFIEGFATHDEQMLVLLDAEKLAVSHLSPTGLADQAA